MRNRALRIVAAAVIAATAASCGGSDDADLSVDPQDFVTQANAVCTKVAEQTDRLAAPTASSSRRQVEALLASTLEISRKGLSELRSLEPPDDGRQTLNQYLDKLDEAIALLARVDDAARSNDDKRVRKLSPRVQAAGDEARRSALDYGLAECGRAG